MRTTPGRHDIRPLRAPLRTLVGLMRTRTPRLLQGASMTLRTLVGLMRTMAVHWAHQRLRALRTLVGLMRTGDDVGRGVPVRVANPRRADENRWLPRSLTPKNPGCEPS